MCFRAPEGDQNSLSQKGQWYSLPLDQPDFASTNSFSTSSRVSKPNRCALLERSETLALTSGIDSNDSQSISARAPRKGTAMPGNCCEWIPLVGSTMLPHAVGERAGM